MSHHNRRLRKPLFVLAGLLVMAPPALLQAQRTPSVALNAFGEGFDFTPLEENARKALQNKLVGTRWRVARNEQTIHFDKVTYRVSDWGQQRGIWMAIGHNRVGAVACEGSHNDFVFEASFKTGSLTINGELFSKITRIQDVQPADQRLDGPLFESVLGVYGRAIRGQRHAFVNLRPPNRDLWTKEIEARLKGTVAYAEVDYIGSAKLVIARSGRYTIDLPASGTQLRLNDQLIEAGNVELKKGVYNVEIYTNHWGQPYLKYAHAVVRETKSQSKIPFVNTQTDIQNFLSRRIDDRRVQEVTVYKPPRVTMTDAGTLISPAKFRPPQIKLRAASNQMLGNATFAGLTLEVFNPNAMALPYTGYTSDAFDPPLRPGHISPLFQIDVQRDGKWEPQPHGWCGTGLADLELAPQSSSTFQVAIPAGNWQAIKVGFGHHPGWSVGDESSTTTIWSTVFSRDEIEKSQAR